jgi:hypothetical protein
MEVFILLMIKTARNHSSEYRFVDWQEIVSIRGAFCTKLDSAVLSKNFDLNSSLYMVSLKYLNQTVMSEKSMAASLVAVTKPPHTITSLPMA